MAARDVSVDNTGINRIIGIQPSTDQSTYE